MKSLFFLLFAVISFGLSAQISLGSSYNMPRSGDRLIKQQVEYKAPGDAGVDALWDFSRQKAIDDHYELRYDLVGVDSIAGTEHRTMYYYYLRGDSLYSLGYENPTTLVNYRKSEPLLVFPFVYGRTFTDYFDGTGNYCRRLDIHVQGKSTVTADAAGSMVLPGGDTLHHVLRVHTCKQMIEKMTPIVSGSSLRSDTLPFVLDRDSIELRLANDSSSIQVDTWRWYAEGYRYPVFESVEGSVGKPGARVPYYAVSFYYPPYEQYYALEADAENQTRRDGLAEKEYSVSNEDSGSNAGNYSDDLVSYGLTINSEGLLRISYTLHSQADVTIGLFDLQGRQLSHIQRLQSPEGSYTEAISLNDLTAGEYLFRLTVGGKTFGEKVVKR